MKAPHLKEPNGGFNTVILGVILVVVAVVISLILFLTSDDGQETSTQPTQEETTEQEATTQPSPEGQPTQPGQSEEQSDPEDPDQSIAPVNQPQLPANWDQLSLAEKIRANPFGCLKNKINEKIYIDSITGRCLDKRSDQRPQSQQKTLQLQESFPIYLVNYDVAYFYNDAGDIEEDLDKRSDRQGNFDEIKPIDFSQFGVKVTEQNCANLSNIVNEPYQESLKNISRLPAGWQSDDSLWEEEFTPAERGRIVKAQSAVELMEVLWPLVNDYYKADLGGTQQVDPVNQLLPVGEIRISNALYQPANNASTIRSTLSFIAPPAATRAYSPMLRATYLVKKHFQSHKITLTNLADQIDDYQICNWQMTASNQTGRGLDRTAYLGCDWVKLFSNFSQLTTGINNKIPNQSIINCKEGLDVSINRDQIISNNSQTSFKLSFIISASNQNPVIEFNLAQAPRSDTLTDWEDYLTDDNYTNYRLLKN